jgi:hypothetical protein
MKYIENRNMIRKYENEIFYFFCYLLYKRKLLKIFLETVGMYEKNVHLMLYIY